ncbi:MAG: hypothetical protein EBX40_02010 [Gammaproteobacteria bacterium]|nr:hypothetical protein [Gammaproteobacteria bacterium]
MLTFVYKRDNTKMKQKTIKMKHKKKDLDFAYVEFDSLVEALDHVSEEDVLRIYNFGARELAKSLAQGKDPFAPKKKIVKLNTKTLTKNQIEVLVKVGLLPEG